MYKNIYNENDPWYLSICKSATWKVSGLLRKLRAGPSGAVAWWKMNQQCKALNRALLEEAKRSEKAAKYPAPTPQEIQDFIDWAESHRMNFDKE